MSIFDRRAPITAPRPRRFTCEHCEWFSYDPDATLGHMFDRHINRRVRTVSPNPGRRALDGLVMSPSTRRFIQAAEAGEGLHRGMPRKRFD